MMLKTVQWNIGGGKIRSESSDPTLDASYSDEGLEYVIDILRGSSPDIVTLQETHADAKRVQARVIAEALSLPFYFNDEYDDSHLEPGQRFGQAVLSRFPISNHTFELFLNPNYRIERPDGSIWLSHDKGVSKCSVAIDSGPLQVETLHLVPFNRFKVDLREAAGVVHDVISKISTDTSPALIQGDFNIDGGSLFQFFPGLAEGGLKECSPVATDPKGRRYDRVLFRGLDLKESSVLKTVLTDHYPVYSEFEIKQV